MNRKIILVPPAYAYGDCLSVIGLLYYLLNHYDTVYFNIDGIDIIKYYNEYFSNDCLFKKRIFINSTKVSLKNINNGKIGEYDVCNTRFENHKYLSHPKVINYFNCDNPLYNYFNIPEELCTKPNLKHPNKNVEINHIAYYKIVGLNNKVRMDYFNYSRNLDKEKEIKDKLFKKYEINEGDKYNIINDPIVAWKYKTNNKIKKYINNSHPIINISDISPCIGLLTLLLEGAESIHFIENNNVNFFYHSQYKKIFNYNKNIYFHVWLRNRDWLWYKNYNFDSAWKMMSEPKLDNWKFIFNKNELNLI